LMFTHLRRTISTASRTFVRPPCVRSVPLRRSLTLGTGVGVALGVGLGVGFWLDAVPLAHASSEKPSHAYLLFKKAQRARDLENWRAVVRFCDEFLRLYPTHVSAPEVFFQKGYALEEMGKYDAAVECFKTCAEMENTNPILQSIAYDSMGITYIKSKKYSDAISAYERSLALSPQARVYSSLGHLLQMSNRDQEAIIYFDKAIVMKKDESDFHFLRGISFLKLGDILTAKECFLKALELEPEHPDAEMLVEECDTMLSGSQVG